MTQENDVVLIYVKDKPFMFARIEGFQADIKPDWFHVKLLLLQVPLQTVTWLLRTGYINGQEFTMNGNKMRLERVVCPDDPEETSTTGRKDDEKKDQPRSPGKIISLSDMKKKSSAGDH
jgi:hypothetical protein